MALALRDHETAALAVDTHAGEREKLLAAAWRLLERTGFENVKVQSVARSADLSIRAFYRHFASKDELMAALLEEERERGAGLMAELMTGTPEEQVRTFVTNIVSLRYGRRTGPRAKLFSLLGSQLEHRGCAMSSHDPLLEVLERAIRAGMETGAFPNADAHRDATFVLALCARLTEAEHHDLPPDRVAGVNAVADFAVKALTA